MNTSIFKAYDIRGIYPTDINKERVEKIGAACAKMLDEGEIVVAHDIRHGSQELSEVITKSIETSAQKFNKKMNVRVVGLSTTPMFYFLVNKYGASGGCMITASHNPKNYNGVKIVKKGAEMVSGTEVLEVVKTLE